jgi:hypothetical protein
MRRAKRESTRTKEYLKHAAVKILKQRLIGVEKEDMKTNKQTKPWTP